MAAANQAMSAAAAMAAGPQLTRRRRLPARPRPGPRDAPPQGGPRASLYLTLVGILAGFLSTFWAYGYQRIAARMQEYLDG
jgi:hypothetical protein